MDETNYPFVGGGLPALFMLLLFAILLLFAAIILVSAMIFQRRRIPLYSAREVNAEYREIQHSRGTQWQVTLLGTIIINIFLWLFAIILRGPLSALFLALIFFDLFVILIVIRQFDRQRLLKKRIKELESQHIQGEENRDIE